MKKICLFIGFLFFVACSKAQEVPRPKLVVGIVVDQMRWDFLYRYYDRYGKGGFKRLLNEGFSCENAYIPYTPTYTAPGHACVYSGSVPSLNGIVGNNWYDRQKKRVVYCTDDFSVSSVGSNSVAGKMSPKNMWSNTITDELRLATNFRSKTIAIALKDRGAILPGGHSANAAYWFDNASGGWISSTFYMQELPEWVRKFNDRKLPDLYLKQNWNTLYPIQTYVQSTADSTPYEGRLTGEDLTFPHTTATITANRYEAFRATPSGNTYTFEMARAAVEAERLGRRGVTDFLALSFSSPDYIGHTFGPNSIEVEDTYLRLDRELDEFLKYLDATTGKGQYLVFLTADHGAAHNPAFLRDNKIAAGIYDQVNIRRQLNETLQATYNIPNLVEHTINFQFFLNDSIIRRNNLDRKQVKQTISDFLLRQESVSAVVDLADLSNAPLPAEVKRMVQNGYNQRLSGDLQVIPKPQWFENWGTGTTHGAWNPYDAHIPLLWFGWNVKKGRTNREVYMSDIAPTLAAMLRIQEPNASMGKVITELLK